MVDQHGAQQEARKLKPVYDALDTGSYKLAIQHCNKLLKKQPNHETVRALKSLALLRGGKGEESIQLCDELLVSKPTDETVLGILSHVLKHLDRTPEITVMFEEAFKKQPHNEELGAQTFMSMIRVGSWKSAQVISLKMFKAFKHTKYLFWSIMSAVLQAQNAGGNSPGHSDHAPMLLTLALKLVASSPVPTFVSPDHLYLHLTILRSLDMIDQAYELIQSDRGKRLCETSLVVEELRKDIFQAKGTCREEASLCFERLDRRGDRNWTTFLSLIDATLKVISLNDPLSDQGSKTTPEPSASSSRSDDPAVNLSTNDNAADPDPELTPKPIPHLELPFEPQAMVDGVRDLFERLARHDGIKERGGHLAVLHLEKKLRARDDTQDGIEPRLLVPLLQTYFSNFGDKACCFEDLKPYIADLKKTAESGAASELDEWHTFLTSQVPQAVSSLDDLQRIINIFKLQRFLLSEPFDAEAEHTRAIEYLKHYFEALPLGKILSHI
ncbi:hypothetical protein FRB99_004017 [Tulasnella sp. 403]|nr:hypothetical protein FRB99_004017 [Tulasnella sp. 403]